MGSFKVFNRGSKKKEKEKEKKVPGTHREIMMIHIYKLQNIKFVLVSSDCPVLTGPGISKTVHDRKIFQNNKFVVSKFEWNVGAQRTFKKNLCILK